MAFCGKCGVPLKNEIAFFGGCGTRIGELAAPTSTALATSRPPQPTASQMRTAAQMAMGAAVVAVQQRISSSACPMCNSGMAIVMRRSRGGLAFMGLRGTSKPIRTANSPHPSDWLGGRRIHVHRRHNHVHNRLGHLVGTKGGERLISI